MGNRATRVGMNQLWDEIIAGKLTRRDVLKRATALGLSAPIITGLLAACGSSDKATATKGAATGGGSTPTASGSTSGVTASTGPGTTSPVAGTTPSTGSAAPTATTAANPNQQAGGGGLLRLLWWQAPTIMNPHLATGTKDFDASRVCYEPLADFDLEGNGIPMLAAEMPSLENGGVAQDGKSVTWKLRPGIKWHDGTPFSANDVVFTWTFASDPATSAVTLGNFAAVDTVEAVDDNTVKLTFKDQNPAWFDVFTGPNGMILPEHIFKDFQGAKSRDAPANLKPVGTGPFMVTDFKPGDTVFYNLFPDYWDAGKPFFDKVEMKGGGTSPDSARAVLQSGEADWSWNVQVEPQILEQYMQGGSGEIVSTPGASAERIMVNFADPNTEVGGAKSEPSTQHPVFKNKDARNAIALAIQRDVVAKQLYGEGTATQQGQATSNNLNAPGKFVSKNTSWKYDLAAAKALLANVPAAQGYRVLFQTSVNSVRQKTQEIIKADLEKIGFTVELKSVDAAVFFSSAEGNPDTYPHFYADIEMYTNGPSSPYPLSWAERFRSDELASQANKWAGTNITRYNNPEFDKLHDQARVEMDPAKQSELFIAMNDMSVNEFVEIPIVWRAGVAAKNTKLKGQVGTPWSSDVYDIKNWRMES